MVSCIKCSYVWIGWTRKKELVPMNFGNFIINRAIYTKRDIVVHRLYRGRVSNLLSDTNLFLVVGLDSQGKISSGSLE